MRRLVISSAVLAMWLSGCAHLLTAALWLDPPPDCSKLELPAGGYSAAFECVERADGTTYWRAM
jgi:hypothetical protein